MIIIRPQSAKTSCHSDVISISNQLNHKPGTLERQGIGQSPSEESLTLSSSGELPRERRWSSEGLII